MIVLGSTGSIGVNTLNIAREFGLEIDVLVAGNNTKLLNEQIKAFTPSLVVVSKKELAKEVDHPKVLYAEEGIVEAIHQSKSEVVVNALVGFAGLRPTIEAIKCGKKIALANKESLVVAGEFIDTGNLVPIDSEHFALWYLLQDKTVSKMTITASGGAFRNTPLERLGSVTVEEALNHPNWSMGRKITIDSATMVNKLFELIEAKWLFGTNRMDAIIETKSLIHALVDFADGSSTAHLAYADMRLPIAYALLGKVERQIVKPVDLVEVGSLEFRKIDEDRYPIWQAKEQLLENTHLGVVLNAANEVAVEKFLNGTINFLEISEINLEALERFHTHKASSVEDIYMIDQEVRNFFK